MNGNSVVLDTNIVLYILSGDHALATFLKGRKLYISFVTQLELLGYPGLTETDKRQVSEFLKECIIIDINEQIKQFVITIKQSYRIKLPDSIIASTAGYLGMPLVTAYSDFLPSVTITEKEAPL